MTKPEYLDYETIRAVYLQEKSTVNLKDYIKIHLYKNSIIALTNTINTDTRLINLFNSNLGIIPNLLKQYVNNKFSASQRLEFLQKDCLFLLKYFPNTYCINHSVDLFNIDSSWRVAFHFNFLNSQEGLWSITLFHNEERIYTVSFTLGCKDTLFIGSIQGAHGNNSQELIRHATKKFHGLRPQQFIIWLALTIAEVLQLNQVIAVGSARHALTNVRRRLRKNHYSEQYDAIWMRYQAKQNANGSWVIPKMTLKPLEKVSTKKRAMYRRRYEMLDDITISIRDFFIEQGKNL